MCCKKMKPQLDRVTSNLCYNEIRYKASVLHDFLWYMKKIAQIFIRCIFLQQIWVYKACLCPIYNRPQ